MVRRQLCVVVVLVALLCTGCAGVGAAGGAGAGLTPAQQQVQIDNAQKVTDTLKDVAATLGGVSKGLKDLHDQAATQPSGAQVAAALDHATPAVDRTAETVAAVAHVAETFTQALKDEHAANSQAQAHVLDQVAALTVAVAQTTHQVAPNTSADNYAGLAAIAALGISKILSSVLNRKTLETAITTPGTTLSAPPAAAGAGPPPSVTGGTGT